MNNPELTLEQEFHQKCIEGYDVCKKELGYNATYWLRMVHENGGVLAAERLLSSKEIPEGLMTLWELGRLDMSLEDCVLNPRYRTLFTEEELKTARTRLEKLEYKPKW